MRFFWQNLIFFIVNKHFSIYHRQEEILTNGFENQVKNKLIINLFFSSIYLYFGFLFPNFFKSLPLCK